MLRPATLVDLPILRALIRDGAAAGTFDRHLATDSPETTRLFTNLRQALTAGYFVEEDPRTGKLVTVAVPGYMYLAGDGGTSHRPAGFGFFKAAGDGYELWLSGIDPVQRGQGTPMLAELLKTAPGQKAYIVRISTAGPESQAMAQLLVSCGYAGARLTPQTTWFLRKDTPEEVGEPLRPARRPSAAG
jgi:hypothetical protein